MDHGTGHSPPARPSACRSKTSSGAAATGSSSTPSVTVGPLARPRNRSAKRTCARAPRQRSTLRQLPHYHHVHAAKKVLHIVALAFELAELPGHQHAAFGALSFRINQLRPE